MSSWQLKREVVMGPNHRPTDARFKKEKKRGMKPITERKREYAFDVIRKVGKYRGRER